jgi:hypothetical protein
MRANAKLDAELKRKGKQMELLQDSISKYGTARDGTRLGRGSVHVHKAVASVVCVCVCLCVYVCVCNTHDSVSYVFAVLSQIRSAAAAAARGRTERTRCCAVVDEFVSLACTTRVPSYDAHVHMHTRTHLCHTCVISCPLPHAA